MSMRCLFGLHRPSVASIARRPGGFVGLCESCGRSLERSEGAAWTEAMPLAAARDRAA